MRLSFALLALASGTAALTQEVQLDEYWFVFLVRGESRAQMDDEARTKGMEGHLGNINRLVDDGKAVAAGPFEGDQDRRGIVILRGDKYKNREEVVKDFAPDPFVQAGRLRPQVLKWAAPKGWLRKWRTPKEMKASVFVVLELGQVREPVSDAEGSSMQKAHMRHFLGLKETGDLGLAGPVLDDGDVRWIMVFKHDSLEKAKLAVSQDPLVKADRLKPTFLKVWMAAGIVGD